MIRNNWKFYQDEYDEKLRTDSLSQMNWFPLNRILNQEHAIRFTVNEIKFQDSFI